MVFINKRLCYPSAQKVQCNRCNKILSNAANLRKHVSVFHPELVCKICGLHEQTIDRLIKHLYDHALQPSDDSSTTNKKIQPTTEDSHLITNFKNESPKIKQLDFKHLTIASKTQKKQHLKKRCNKDSKSKWKYGIVTKHAVKRGKLQDFNNQSKGKIEIEEMQSGTGKHSIYTCRLCDTSFYGNGKIRFADFCDHLRRGCSVSGILKVCEKCGLKFFKLKSHLKLHKRYPDLKKSDYNIFCFYQNKAINLPGVVKSSPEDAEKHSILYYTGKKNKNDSNRSKNIKLEKSCFSQSQDDVVKLKNSYDAGDLQLEPLHRCESIKPILFGTTKTQFNHNHASIKEEDEAISNTNKNYSHTSINEHKTECFNNFQDDEMRRNHFYNANSNLKFEPSALCESNWNGFSETVKVQVNHNDDLMIEGSGSIKNIKRKYDESENMEKPKSETTCYLYTNSNDNQPLDDTIKPHNSCNHGNHHLEYLRRSKFDANDFIETQKTHVNKNNGKIMQLDDSISYTKEDFSEIRKKSKSEATSSLFTNENEIKTVGSNDSLNNEVRLNKRFKSSDICNSKSNPLIKRQKSQESNNKATILEGEDSINNEKKNDNDVSENNIGKSKATIDLSNSKNEFQKVDYSKVSFDVRSLVLQLKEVHPNNRLKKLCEIIGLDDSLNFFRKSLCSTNCYSEIANNVALKERACPKRFKQKNNKVKQACLFNENKIKEKYNESVKLRQESQAIVPVIPQNKNYSQFPNEPFRIELLDAADMTPGQINLLKQHNMCANFKELENTNMDVRQKSSEDYESAKIDVQSVEDAMTDEPSTSKEDMSHKYRTKNKVTSQKVTLKNVNVEVIEESIEDNKSVKNNEESVEDAMIDESSTNKGDMSHKYRSENKITSNNVQRIEEVKTDEPSTSNKDMSHKYQSENKITTQDGTLENTNKQVINKLIKGNKSVKDVLSVKDAMTDQPSTSNEDMPHKYPTENKVTAPEDSLENTVVEVIKKTIDNSKSLKIDAQSVEDAMINESSNSNEDILHKYCSENKVTTQEDTLINTNVEVIKKYNKDNKSVNIDVQSIEDAMTGEPSTGKEDKTHKYHSENKITTQEETLENTNIEVNKKFIKSNKSVKDVQSVEDAMTDKLSTSKVDMSHKHHNGNKITTQEESLENTNVEVNKKFIKGNKSVKGVQSADDVITDEPSTSKVDMSHKYCSENKVTTQEEAGPRATFETDQLEENDAIIQDIDNMLRELSQTSDEAQEGDSTTNLELNYSDTESLHLHYDSDSSADAIDEA